MNLSGSNCPRCRYAQAVPAPTYTCPECGLLYESHVEPSLLRFGDRRWLRKIHFGCLLIQRTLFVLLCCILVTLASGFLSLFLEQWIDPAPIFQVLGVVLWGMSIVFIVAVGSLMVGLLALFAANPYDELPWMLVTRRWISYAAVPAFAVWFLADQPKYAAILWFPYSEIVGAVVLALSALALLHLRVELKSRCADGTNRRASSLRSVAIAAFVCAAIFVAAALERKTETLQMIWIVWIITLAFSSRSLERALQRELKLQH